MASLVTPQHLQRELLQAAATNDVRTLRLLLAHTRLPLSAVFRWANPRTDETQLRSLLMVASHQGAVDIVLELALAGADANQQAPLDGFTALHTAVEGSSPACPAVVELLLRAGASPNRADVYGRRPADLVAELTCSSSLLASCSATTNAQVRIGAQGRGLAGAACIVVSSHFAQLTFPTATLPHTAVRGERARDGGGRPLRPGQGRVPHQRLPHVLVQGARRVGGSPGMRQIQVCV